MKPGDVVQLRTGGPKMTILAEAPPNVGLGYFLAGWFPRSGQNTEEMRTLTTHGNSLKVLEAFVEPVIKAIDPLLAEHDGDAS